jgi:hypothetical protein
MRRIALFALCASGCIGGVDSQGIEGCIDEDCPPGQVCSFLGECAQLCASASNCPTNNVCESGLCVELPPECESAADCVGAGPCEQPAATCDGGRCSYAPAGTDVTCDDGDACTSNDHCDGLGSCAAGTPMDCSTPGAPRCDAERSLVIEATGSGQCALGACVFPEQEVACNGGCGVCLTGCRVGEGYVPAGSFDPANPCRYCDPSIDDTAYTAVTCEQSSDACLESAGVCDDARGDCTGEGCCVFAPTPSGGDCTLGGGGTGQCDGDGRCAGCLAPADCDDLNPCTTDACNGGSCANTPQPGATCSRPGGTNNGVCVAAGASAVCKLSLGQGCSDGDVCASGYCTDGVCCDGACGGACMRCNASGACTPIASATDPDNECPTQSCYTGSCNGSGACAYAVSGTGCGTCQSCNGSGTCISDLTRDSDCTLCRECGTGGTCVYAGAGTDPKGECALVTCRTGQCNGAGACQNKTNGSVCTGGHCYGGYCEPDDPACALPVCP